MGVLLSMGVYRYEDNPETPAQNLSKTLAHPFEECNWIEVKRLTVQESNLCVSHSKCDRDTSNPPVNYVAQALRIERRWACFRDKLGYQQPTPEYAGINGADEES